ncbi:glycosyltransferase family 9 protein [Kaarinaea lacus]
MISSMVVVNFLRDRYGEVDFLVDEGFFSMLETEPGIRGVTRREALEQQYDILVDLTSSKDSRRFVRKVRAKTKVGLYRTWSHRLRLLTTYNVLRKKKVIRGSAEQDHIMKGFYPILEYFGTHEALTPKLQPGKPTDSVNALLAKARAAGSGKVVAIHFGATNPKRRPPDSLLRDIIDYSKLRNAGIILLGEEQEIAAKLVGASDHHAQLFQGDLNDLKYLLSKVDLFIGPCSGPLHMAAALDTPMIGLYGPTVTRISAPVSDKLHVVEIDMPCRPCVPQQPCPYNIACLNNLPRDRLESLINRYLNASSSNE